MVVVVQKGHQVETAESQYNRAPSIIRRREGLDYASKLMEEAVTAETMTTDGKCESACMHVIILTDSKIQMLMPVRPVKPQPPLLPQQQQQQWMMMMMMEMIGQNEFVGNQTADGS